jgi:cell division protein FtsQ
MGSETGELVTAPIDPSTVHPPAGHPPTAGPTNPDVGAVDVADLDVAELVGAEVVEGELDVAEVRVNPRPSPRYVELPDQAWQPRPPRAPRAPRAPRRPKGPRPAYVRRRIIFATAVGLLCAIFGAYAITRSTALDVDHVTISGQAHTTAEQIQAVSGLRVHSAMTDVDLAGARRRIGALPWIDQVKVRRQWQGTVQVRVTERVPLAAVHTDTAVVLVDRTGRVLEAVATAPADLVRIEISDTVADAGTVQPKVASLLTPDLRAWVTSVSRSADGSPLLFLRDGVKVVLGDAAHITEKLIDLTTVLARVDLKDLCRIDVSVVHNPAVARNPNCSQ